MLLLKGGGYLLGDNAALDPSQTVPSAGIIEGRFMLESFCVEVLPFPGIEGAAWPRDGLTGVMAARFDQRLSVWNRRLCTITELLFAAAGPNNWRYPYHPDSYDPDTCDPDDRRPQPLGHYRGCVSSTGVRDFGVRSAWGRLDPAMAQHLAIYDAPPLPPWESAEAPASAGYASYGGTSRRDTFYRPHNFGVHSHGGTRNHSDDGARVCMNPGLWTSQSEAGYLDWRAEILTGGAITHDPKTGEGWFYEPTIVADRPVEDELVQEEIFGPVLTVQVAEDAADACRLANATRYGLVAGIYTADVTQALALARDIDAGQIFINEYFAGGVEVPFGGNKASGFGREKGVEGLKSYSKLKSVAARID